MNTQNRYSKNYLEMLIVRKFIQIKNQIATYEAQRFNPESSQYSGITQSDRANRAASEAEEAKNIQFYQIKKTGYLSVCILTVARELYLQADDFKNNPFIKISNLKAVVTLRNWHDTYYPDGKIYSTKYLLNVI